MRYRPASSVPGKNRLSELEEEVPRRADLDPLLGVRAGDRGVAGMAVATVRVANSSAGCVSASIFCPQVEQKRLFSAIALAQDGHSFMADAFHDRTRADGPAEMSFAPVESRKGGVPTARFPSRLIKPDVPISSIRLSDRLHATHTLVSEGPPAPGEPSAIRTQP